MEALLNDLDRVFVLEWGLVCALAIAGCYATYTDIHFRDIPNRISWGLLAVGFVGQSLAWMWGVIDLGQVGLVFLVGFAVSYALYVYGFWAAGDAKLFWAFALVLPPTFFPAASFTSFNAPIWALLLNALVLSGVVLLVWWVVVRPPAATVAPVVWTASSANPRSAVLQAGEAAPDFALPTVQGSTVALSEWRGQPVLLAFVTAGCPYCQKLYQELEAFELNEGQQLVLICTGEEGARKIGGTYAFTYPVLIDSADTVSQAYKTPGVPTVYQIDGAGKVVDLKVGWPSAWAFVQRFGRAPPSEGA